MEGRVAAGQVLQLPPYNVEVEVRVKRKERINGRRGAGSWRGRRIVHSAGVVAVSVRHVMCDDLQCTSCWVSE